MGQLTFLKKITAHDFVQLNLEKRKMQQKKMSQYTVIRYFHIKKRTVICKQM